MKSVETYVATKREHDAGVPDANDRDEAFVQSRMIIFRNDDVRADASGGSSASAGSETPFCGRDIIRLKRDSESGKILQNTLAEVAQLAKRGISSTFVNGTKSSVDNVLVKRAASGCPTTTKVLYMGVAADCVGWSWAEVWFGRVYIHFYNRNTLPPTVQQQQPAIKFSATGTSLAR